MLKFGAEIAQNPDIRQLRRVALRRLQRKPILTIDGNTGEIFGNLVAEIKSAGRSHRYRVQDLWLASQALQYGFRLLTRNERGFIDIPGLELAIYKV